MKDHLTEDEIQKFERDGLLVVDGFLDTDEVRKAQEQLAATLRRFGVDTLDLENTGLALSNLSSTNGSGGVLDLFYDEWKMKIATDPRLFQMTSQLWQLYTTKNEESPFGNHPYTEFDTQRGFAYIDRIGYRLPTTLATILGKQASSKYPIQRSLTPHLDCCPDQLYTDDKFRPIQCFISLTSNTEPNTGGFEAAKGFHKEFSEWATNRTPSTIKRKLPNGDIQHDSVPAPCVGNYTHIRPKEDAEIMKRVAHVSVKAGSIVFWDFRLPHANAYTHVGDDPRSVIYCSFLPDVPVNQRYTERQLENLKNRRQPSDQWINDSTGTNEVSEDFEERVGRMTPLQKRLFGIEPW